ncbi:helix-turn-helix domain-containing protein [Streptomyces amakusaensis]|uniref:MarR family transcriptional regulator n=1 Tax=Streptomyces amakusaensis TaxID=67271 RepID=A0ABW0AJH1_9ACTN
MPGGRLTHEDRRRIRAGLDGGLGYAEIARDLERPTSTVTREVARNGGPEGYRADGAHEASKRRARRHGTRAAPAAVPSPLTGSYGRDPDAVRDFAEEFAALMVATGLPRMAARVLARLVTTDSGALTAAELVRGLKVSPASVSKAVGYLEGLEVVRREREDRRRRERYVIDDGVWLRAWLTSARTNAMWADAARRGADLLHAATPAGARLAEMGGFFARLSDDMSGGPAGPAADDVRTVLAALVTAGVPLSPEELAAALDWPAPRIRRALEAAERDPHATDPLTLRRSASGAHTATATPGRLTAAQGEALARCRSSRQ